MSSFVVATPFSHSQFSFSNTSLSPSMKPEKKNPLQAAVGFCFVWRLKKGRSTPKSHPILRRRTRRCPKSTEHGSPLCLNSKPEWNDSFHRKPTTNWALAVPSTAWLLCDIMWLDDHGSFTETARGCGGSDTPWRLVRVAMRVCQGCRILLEAKLKFIEVRIAKLTCCGWNYYFLESLKTHSQVQPSLNTFTIQ